MKKRSIYWLAEEITVAHRERVVALEGRGFKIEFFASFERLRQTFASRRVSIIVVSSARQHKTSAKFVVSLAQAPEFAGVRFVLSLDRPDPELVVLASSQGFRDVIVFDTDANMWLQRFLFATASSAAVLSQPLPQMSLNAIASVRIPARIVWINYDHMWIETRASPIPGTQIKLSGNIIEALGISHLSVTVVESHHSNLRYRFSEALIVRWQVSPQLVAKQRILIDHLKSTAIGRLCKAFVAIQTPALRTTVIELLRSDPRFEVAAALLKQSIINEPKYFGPNVIVIEDKLIAGSEFAPFVQMIRELKAPIMILVIGDGANLDELRKLTSGHTYAGVRKIPPKLAELVFSRYQKISAPPALDHANNVNIGAESDFSHAALTVSGRLTMVHPTAAQLALPVALGNFGLCRIDSPLFRRTLGRAVHAKITGSFPDPRGITRAFPHAAEVALADVFKDDRKKLAVAICDMMAEQLLGTARAGPPQDAVVQGVQGSTSATFESEEQGALESNIEMTLLKGYTIQADAYEPVPQVSKSVGVQKARTQRRILINALIALKSSRTVRKLLYLIIFSVATIWLILSLVELTAPHFTRSGSVFSDQLKGFKHSPGN